jgi:ankyrin repeat protein
MKNKLSMPIGDIRQKLRLKRKGSIDHNNLSLDVGAAGKLSFEYEDEDENDAGFDVDYINFKDRSSRTALQYAAYHGHLKIVEALVDAGAEVNTKNSK